MRLIGLILGVPLVWAGLSRAQPAFVRPEPVTIADKTLVVWCQPNQASYLPGGHGVFTIQEGGKFDSIVLGEIRSGVWMAGSDNFNRTQTDQSTLPTTDDTAAMVQIAIVYQGNQVRIFRNGIPYSEYSVANPVTFGAAAEIFIGWRHFGAGAGSFFAGQIEEARLYDQALPAAALAALSPGSAGSITPLARWTFENGTLADSMNRFDPGQLRGQATIQGGRLQLDGAGDYFVVKPAAARYEPTLHFRPEGAAAGDAIPFYHKGQYHLFYLRHNEWAHLVSRDLITWTELPTAIPVDHTILAGADAEAAWTGSVVRKDSEFHLFYTGKNLADPFGDQKVMVATSRDLITWTKQPDRTFYADGTIYWSKPVNGPIDSLAPYHHQAFRDPAVVWNEAAGEWWMVLHAIVANGSAPAMGLYASTDLLTWTARPPLLTYPMALSGDCPDIFELGGDWYIINGNHEYTWAPELGGPWSQDFLPYDTGDLRVAKTMWDGRRRLLVGWIGDNAGESDAGAPLWGGHLCMAREIYSPAPGQLGQRPVAEMVAVFSNQVASLPDGAPPTQALSLPRDFMLQATLANPSSNAKAEIVFRRPTGSTNGGYYLQIDFGTRQVELGGTHKQFRRVCDFDPAQPLEVRLFAIGTIIECFINDRYAFTMRAYDFHGSQMIVRALQGAFQLQNSGVFTQGTPPSPAPPEPDFALMAASGRLRWIWHKEPGESATTAAPAGKVRLRRSFDLSADNMPDWAEFVFAVDDSAEVFVNGQRLGSFAGWNPLTQLDIRPWLQPGRNVIAVEAENIAPSPAGFVGLVELEGYSPVMFDGSTRSSLVSAGATWADPAFDDSGWAGATLLVPADLGPWGRISGPLPENPTQQRIPENFPTFAVPGFETEMDRMRQILFGHYQMDLSNLPTFNLQWLAPAAIWAGLETRPQDSWTRASLRARLLSMRVMPDGYVSCHQHEGLGHSEGWPFPLYTQTGGAGWMFSTAGLLYGPELGVFPATSVADWTFRRATAASLDVTGGLRLDLTGVDAAMTSPTINVDPQAATWVRIKLIPGTTPLQPYVQWRTASAGFSEARKVAFEIPADATPGVPIDVDVPIHQLALGGDNITRLRVGFGNTGPGEVTILRVFTAVDTRHNVNNANFVLAAATYFNWTGDVDFLRDYISTLRRIFRYSVEEFGVRTHGVVSTPWAGKDGRSGLTLGPGGSKTINYGLGVGNNYWDLLPFGGKDAYATIYHFAATRAMEQLEATIAARPEWNIPAPAAEYGATHLAADLEQIRGASAQTFWKADKGRFGAAVDSTGKLWDYGFTFLNNEAMYYGLTAPAQDRQIVDWLSGARSIAGETATGSDLYRWRFGPRATTVRNIDYYNYVWTNPETLPFGGQVQDGGAVLGFSFHDLMGRLRTNGPDEAWARLREILTWYGEVQAAGGYRKYYTPETAAERGTLQGGGTAGGLGIDQEFYETLLVPLIMTEGFLGLSVTPERVRFAPQLPQEWPSLEVGRIQYRDWMLRAKATPYEFEMDLEAGGTAGPIEVELGAGRWDVQVLDAQNQVLATSSAGAEEGTTVVIDDPASTRLVATRAAELNVWLPEAPGDWNTPANWHLGMVPGGTHVPLFNHGGTAYLATNAPALTGAALVGQGAGNGTLEIRSGGSLALGQLLLGRDSGRTGTLVVDGGTLTVAEVLHVGDGADGTGGHGNVQIVSGWLDAGTADIRLGGNGGAGVTGNFVLSGGTFHAAQIVVGVGSAFTDRGGMMDVTGTITNLGNWFLDGNAERTRSYAITGTGAVIKQGSGTVTLTGTNYYAGATTIEAGRLLIHGDHTGATGDVVVRSGAALGGRGTLGGNLVLENGAQWVFSPGNPLIVAGTVSGGFALTNVAGIAGNSPGRYPLIVGTVDPESFSPVGSTWAQNIGNGQRAWFEVTATSLDLVIANNQTFSGWSEQFGLSGAQASWMASPAGDGIPNLLKYAFNLDPLRHEGTGQYPGQDRGLPYLTPHTTEGLELIYYRDPAKTDLRLTPVWKTNLGATFPWAEVPDHELVDTQNGIERWRARLPLGTGRGFMQIQVEVE